VIDTVAGAATPAAPSAGGGLADDSGTNALAYAVLGLVAMAAGFGSLAFAAASRRDD
jgi:hypothetical protein